MPSFFEFPGHQEPFDFVPNICLALLAITHGGGFDLPSYDMGSALIELPSFPQCRPMINEHPRAIRNPLIFGSLRGNVHAKLLKQSFHLSLRSIGELNWKNSGAAVSRPSSSFHLWNRSLQHLCNDLSRSDWAFASCCYKNFYDQSLSEEEVVTLG
jgi:hypothetical protein